MTDITILICLYNKSVEESDTLQSLLQSDLNLVNATIYLWDNSPVCLSSENLVFLKNRFNKVIYKHTPDNLALSKLYNKVIDEVVEKKGYLMLCDDDSNIPLNFFAVLVSQIEQHPVINLFLPQIFSDAVLVSPAKDYLVFTKHIKQIQPGLLVSNCTTAINSGMVISNRLFKNGFRYDENLRFYGTDNFFMIEYARDNKFLNVLDVQIKHSLSYNSSEDISNKVRIFKEIKRANRIIYQKDFFKRQLVIANNLFVALKLSLKYKTRLFLGH